jgi:uncharacterized coiled-coil DUF342 family protein
MPKEVGDWKSASKRFNDIKKNYADMGKEIAKLKRENRTLLNKIEKYEEVLHEIKQSTRKVRRSAPRKAKKEQQPTEEVKSDGGAQDKV